MGWMDSGQDASAFRGPSADFLVSRQRVCNGELSTD